jgi:hypothetical protein
VGSIEDGEAGGDGTAGRVDVDGNILFRIFRFQEKQLGDDEIGYLVVNRRAKENDVFFEKP